MEVERLDKKRVKLEEKGGGSQDRENRGEMCVRMLP